MSQPRKGGRGGGRGGGGQSREVQISKALSLLLRHAAEKEGLKMNTQGYANVADVLAWRKLKSLKVTFPEILDAVATSDKKRFALLHIPSAEQADSKGQATTTPSKVTDREDEGANDTEQSTTVLSAPPVTQAAQENATQRALSVATSKEDTDPSHFLIRATQGHSIKSVDPASFLERLTLSDEPQAQPSVPATTPSTSLPDTVVHGTYHAAWPLILASGGLKCMGRTHVHFATGPSLESVLAQNKGRGDTEGDGKGIEGLDNGTVISGMRRDAQVLIYINIKKALAAGCPFWRSENGVILSEGMAITGKEGAEEKEKVVPLEFFDVVVERKAGLGVLWEHGKVVQELPQDLAGRRNPKGRRVPPDGEKGRGRSK
ncbi:hypothetical protein VTN00DRAFT_2175 [Thermoascus crustaceus]|uniref:uncharacterized protein n=1 Tax=Thermoascus crustaceus TaxID=5088 RepID=UPI0037430D3C